MMIPAKRYPTDVTNTQWMFILELIPPSKFQKGRGRKPSTELRRVINAINYRWKTGCTWRMLPHDFPKWETVYTYFRTWRKQGILPQLREIMIMKKYPHSAKRLGIVPRLDVQVSDSNKLSSKSPHPAYGEQSWPASNNPACSSSSQSSLGDWHDVSDSEIDDCHLEKASDHVLMEHGDLVR